MSYLQKLGKKHPMSMTEICPLNAVKFLQRFTEALCDRWLHVGLLVVPITVLHDGRCVLECIPGEKLIVSWWRADQMLDIVFVIGQCPNRLANSFIDVLDMALLSQKALCRVCSEQNIAFCYGFFHFVTKKRSAERFFHSPLFCTLCYTMYCIVVAPHVKSPKTLLKRSHLPLYPLYYLRMHVTHGRWLSFAHKCLATHGMHVGIAAHHPMYECCHLHVSTTMAPNLSIAFCT